MITIRKYSFADFDTPILIDMFNQSTLFNTRSSYNYVKPNISTCQNLFVMMISLLDLIIQKIFLQF